jgi:RimJ/RimL family protein N-acetyltransferase
MKLELVSLDDLQLYESMFCNEEHMKHLGGAISAEKSEGMLQRHMRCNTNNTGWVYRIVPEAEDFTNPEDPALQNDDWKRGVGSVCMWTGFHNDADITEIGWGIAPAFKNRGFATKAVSMMLNKAKEDGRWGAIHAFTDIGNVYSIQMCQRLGFQFVEETQCDFDEKPFTAAHYRYN